MATNVLCLVTIFITIGCKQVCLEHCIAMFTQIITIADSTISAVQILKVTCGRWDPLIAQTVFASHSKALYAHLLSVDSKQCFFVYFYQEMVNSKSCSWEERKRE